MFFDSALRKRLLKTSFILLTPFVAFYSHILETQAKIIVEKQSNLGIIKGVVRDQQGNPIKDAIIAVFHLGTSKVLKQVRSFSDGSFMAKVLPGKYTVLAVAQGFNAETVQEVQINRSTELNFGFKLERVGSGNTLPEKTGRSGDSRNRIKGAYSRRSIYQNQEGKEPIDEDTIGVAEEEKELKRKAQSVVETYFADAEEGNFVGLNFATLQPLGENSEIIFSGQTGSKSFAPNRFETTIKTRPNEKHQIRLTGSVSNLGKVKLNNSENQLGQLSFQGLDEWKIRDGVILVLGFDYSRFLGAGNDSSIAPRLGLQVDVNSKTRFKTAYTTQTEEKTWSDAIEFEGSQVLFREQFEPKSISIEDGKPVMSKSRRFEFGLERVLDNKSSVEAMAFFDSVVGRGISLTNQPMDVLSSEDFNEITATQQGDARGVRVVYSRRINGTFSTSAGYSFGTGQKLSSEAITNPANIFDTGVFQTFVGQVNTDLRTGTNVQTIFRLSPQAQVFAIDPFQGRLAIFDPGLSVLVRQSLPTLGLPIQASAVLDARNILDFQSGINNEEGSLRFNSHRRILRGGILVRF
jgi:hypothetical protein